MSRPLAKVAGLFFLSGVCGLVYEVAWVRALGNLFGNTVQSAAMVTAVFMAGLGFGSYAAGAWSDRQARARRAVLLSGYGVAELGAALYALMLALGLPHLGALSAHFATYARDAQGWFEPSVVTLALRALLAVALLLPPTLLLGATFTLLVRYSVSEDVADAGFHIGLLYGVNTAGAALGALLTDLVLVAHVGLLRTQLLAVAIQASVGAGAIVLARGLAEGRSRGSTPDLPLLAQGHQEPASTPMLAAASAGLFLSGFAALGTEMVWFRSLSSALGAYRGVFSIVLATILVGIMAGSLAGGLVTTRHRRSVFLLTQAFFVVTTLVLAATFSPVRPIAVPTDVVSVVILSITRVVLLPSFLLGFAMPVVNGLVQDARSRVGARVGQLYLANTVGSVLGSVTAGFVLAPRIGSQVSLGIFAACAAVAPLPLALANARPNPPRAALLASLALSLPLLAGWFALPENYLASRFLLPVAPDEHLLALHEGLTEIVAVTEGADGRRALVTNGHPMSSTIPSVQRYMRAFVHVPMLQMDQPTRVLVICFGVGNTLHAASLYDSVRELEIADLSTNVLSHAGYFAATNGDVLQDPRVSVFVDDGREHLRAEPRERYDLITLEPPPIAFAGVSSLYSEEFYELAASRLKDGGYMSQWLPIYQVPRNTALQLVRAFVDVSRRGSPVRPVAGALARRKARGARDVRPRPRGGGAQGTAEGRLGPCPRSTGDTGGARWGVRRERRRPTRGHRPRGTVDRRPPRNGVHDVGPPGTNGEALRAGRCPQLLPRLLRGGAADSPRSTARHVS